MSDTLKKYYYKKIVPKLIDQFKYKNIHQVPKLVKVTINRGLGEASQNAKALDILKVLSRNVIIINNKLIL